jgi:hypothetical protein
MTFPELVGEDRKLCECGCGEPAPIATMTSRRSGWVKGEPVRFVHGHHARTPEGRARLTELHRTNRTHGHYSGGRSPTYHSWQAMVRRCTDPNHTSWRYYGGRDEPITVCDRWRDSFEAFLADMGERTAGTSIDRIDVNGNYEPGNVRYATPAQQACNRRPRSKT